MADQDDELDLDNSPSDSQDTPLGPSVSLDTPVEKPAPMNPVLQQYLQNKQNLAQAQQQTNRNEMITGLARAGASLSAGLAHSNQAVNQEPFNQMAATDQQPVVDVQNAQKAQTQDLQNQQTLMSTQKQAADSDPNSPQSVAARAMIKKLYPGKFDDATLEGLSAADIGNSIMKPLELDQKIQEHKDEMLNKAADRQQRADDKADADKDKAYTQLRKDLETFRGNRPVAQAALDCIQRQKGRRFSQR